MNKIIEGNYTLIGGTTAVDLEGYVCTRDIVMEDGHKVYSDKWDRIPNRSNLNKEEIESKAKNHYEVMKLNGMI